MTLENIMRTMPWERACLLGLGAAGIGAASLTMITRSLGTSISPHLASTCDSTPASTPPPRAPPAGLMSRDYRTKGKL